MSFRKIVVQLYPMALHTLQYINGFGVVL